MPSQEHIRFLKQGIGIWNDWRNTNPSVKPDLSHAQLKGADLSGANLSNANLFDADLSGANLTDASLEDANLEQTNLSGAKLVRSNLQCARACRARFNGAELQFSNMRNVDLEAARLYSADMRGVQLQAANLDLAQLRGANLSGAHFGAWIDAGYTMLTDVDLSEVEGLDTTVHHTRSEITVSTIFNSKGRIPEKFLRGCGVPEILIALLPSLFESAFEYCSCFISYSHKDKPFAQRLYDTLQALGIRCWLDEHQVLP